MGGVARKPRIHAPGLLYHVICRGNQRQDVFLDEQDYRAYLHRIGELHQRFPFRLYAYALMSNHVHLLVEVGDSPLSNIMQILQQRYTQYFNRKYARIGHVFHARYKAIICQTDPYLLELVRYIHLNPVRAGIVKRPDDYPWSGHKSYLQTTSPPWLDRDAIIMQFGRSREQALKQYTDFVLSGVGEGHRDDLYDVKEAQVLGDDAFLSTLPLGALADPESAEGELSVGFQLDELARVLTAKAGITFQDLVSSSRNHRISDLRGLFCVIALDCGHRMNDIAHFLHHGASNLGRTGKRVSALLKKDALLDRLRHDIESALKP